MNSNSRLARKATYGTENQTTPSNTSIVLRLQAEDFAKVAAVATEDILCDVPLVKLQDMTKNSTTTYGDHQTQCRNLEQGLHYGGLAIDQILFIEISKIPWGGILARRRCR
jgi:hypothetical protein